MEFKSESYAQFRMAGEKWELIRDDHQADMERRGVYNFKTGGYIGGERIQGSKEFFHAVPAGEWFRARRITADSIAKAHKLLRKELYG